MVCLPLVSYSPGISEKGKTGWAMMKMTGIHLGQAGFVGSLGLHVSNVSAEILELLHSGMEGHDAFGAGAHMPLLGRHPSDSLVLEDGETSVHY